MVISPQKSTEQSQSSPKQPQKPPVPLKPGLAGNGKRREESHLVVMGCVWVGAAESNLLLWAVLFAFAFAISSYLFFNQNQPE